MDGERWTRFWWYEGTGWPQFEVDVLGGTKIYYYTVFTSFV